MYADSPPNSQSYDSQPLSPFLSYQLERQQQFYRLFPAARYHDISEWGAVPQYSSPTYNVTTNFNGPVFQYDNSLTNSGLDRGYTAVDDGALQSRPAEVASQSYSTQPYYDNSYPNTGLEQSQPDLETSTGHHDTNLQSGNYYAPTNPDVVSYYSAQSNQDPYIDPSQQIAGAYYTSEQQYPNGQTQSPNIETHYVPPYSPHSNYETYPNTVNHNDIVDVQPHNGSSYYQADSSTEASPPQHFSQDPPAPVVPTAAQSSETLYPALEETQVPAPPFAVTRRDTSPEVSRPHETIRHEPEPLPPAIPSPSNRGTSGQHRIDPQHPRSLSRIPSQVPKSPNPAGTGWMGPPTGPPLHSQARASMPLSPLPTKRQLEKKPPLACLFCRGRKIACGPPIPGSTDKTCNQCQRRSLPCEYPTESRRGMRKKKVLDSVETASKDSSTGSPSTDAAAD